MAIKKLQQGFTLIELIVVIAIVAVVSTILLFHYSDFSTTIALTTLSEDIGLSARKAQSYATSVRSIAGTNGAMSNTFPAYGVSFSVNPTATTIYDPTAASFPLFVDASSTNNGVTNNAFDNNGTCGSPAVGQECVESFSITNNDKIVSLCTDKAPCMTTSGTVNVVFHRPNPDAVICVAGLDCTTQQASYVKITVQSPTGVQRTVTIWNTGQISIQ
ncbi:MAG: hypothetical protein JWM92_341 [Candidatus Nomurabacteria bacterium]|jgi:prepilin-type N-terminal cleavage/methylation domain-containing protein|nr:hypothetical protein [Candidatus Nomurabacteria bacterium]